MMEIKTVSQNGLNLLIREEGLSLKPYLCSANMPTIGIGCTFYEDGRRVKLSDPPISKDRAIELLKIVLKSFEQKVARVTRDDINQNQFDALVSLAFNIGTGAFDGSTVLKLVNANPTDSAIKQAFLAWRFSAGKPILLARRQREYGLYAKNKIG